MIEAIAAVLLCQLLGEGIARALAVPVPGPVIGLLLLFAGLWLRGQLQPDAPTLEETPLGALSGFLLAHLSLLFVPAGVGIVGQWDLIARHGVGLLLALIISTAAALAVTALVFRAAAGRLAPDEPDGGAER
jgi:holin-like protein